MSKDPIVWKNLTIRIPEELHEEFKILAIQKKHVMKDILVEKINSYIAENKKTVVY